MCDKNSSIMSNFYVPVVRKYDLIQILSVRDSFEIARKSLAGNQQSSFFVKIVIFGPLDLEDCEIILGE